MTRLASDVGLDLKLYFTSSSSAQCSHGLELDATRLDGVVLA